MATKFGLLGSALYGQPFEDEDYIDSLFAEDEEDDDIIDLTLEDFPEEPDYAPLPGDDDDDFIDLTDADEETIGLSRSLPGDVARMDQAPALNAPPLGANDIGDIIDTTDLPEEEEEIVITGRRGTPVEKAPLLPPQYETPEEIYQDLRAGRFDEDAFWGRTRKRREGLLSRTEEPEDAEPGSPAAPERTTALADSVAQSILPTTTSEQIIAMARDMGLDLDQSVAERVATEARRVAQAQQQPGQRELTPEEQADAFRQWLYQQMGVGERRRAAEAQETERRSREGGLAKEQTPGDIAVENFINNPDATRGQTPAQITQRAINIYRDFGIQATVEQLSGQVIDILNYQQAQRERGNTPQRSEVYLRDSSRQLTEAQLREENQRSAIESLQAGARIARMLTEGGIGAVAETVGAEGLAKWAEESRQASQLVLQAMPEGMRAADVASVGDAVSFIKNVVLEQSSLMAMPMTGGVVGSIVRGSMGARLGAFGGGYVLGVGEVQNTNKELSPDEQAGLATLVGGGAVAALDQVVPGRIGSMLVERLGREGAEQFAMRMLMMPVTDRIMSAAGRVAREGVTDAPMEAGTEFMQAVVAEYASSVETGQPIRPGLFERAWEEAVVGAVAGGAFGVGGATAAEAGSVAQERSMRRAAVREMRRADFNQSADQVARNVSDPSRRRGDVSPNDFARASRIEREGRAQEIRPVANGRAVAEEVYGDRGIRITQVERDPNSALGRANPRSWHTRTRAAIDSAPIPGMTFGEYVQGYRDAGYAIIEAIDEVNNPSRHATGPHWHVVLGERGSRSRVAPGEQRGLAPDDNWLQEVQAADREADAQFDAEVAELEAQFEAEAAAEAQFEAEAAAEAQFEAEAAAEARAEEARRAAIEAPTAQEAVARAREAQSPSPARERVEAAKARLDRLADPTQPGPGEVAVFRPGADGVATNEIVGFQNTETGTFRPIGPEARISPAESVSGAQPSTDTSLPEIASTGLSVAPIDIPQVETPRPTVELTDTQTVVRGIDQEQATAIAETVGAPATVPRSDGAFIFPPSAFDAVAEAVSAVAASPPATTMEPERARAVQPQPAPMPIPEPAAASVAELPAAPARPTSEPAAGVGLTSAVAADMSETLTPDLTTPAASSTIPAMTEVTTPEVEELELTTRRLSPQELTDIGIQPEEGELLYAAQTRADINKWTLSAVNPVVRQARVAAAEIVRPDLMGITQEQADQRLAEIIGEPASQGVATAAAEESSPGVGIATPGETVDVATSSPANEPVQASSAPQRQRERDAALRSQADMVRRVRGDSNEVVEVVGKPKLVKRDEFDGPHHEVTLNDGTKVYLYRDTDQFGTSNPQWYFEDALGADARGGNGLGDFWLGGTKAEALERLPGRVSVVRQNKIDQEVTLPPADRAGKAKAGGKRGVGSQSRNATDQTSTAKKAERREGSNKGNEPYIDQEENRADLERLGAGDVMFSLAPDPMPSLAQVLADLPDKIAQGIKEALDIGLPTPTAAEPELQEPAGSTFKPGITKLSDLVKVGEKVEGSNPGGIYEDAEGTRWLVKGANNPSDSRAKNEVLASKLMDAAGISAPEMKLVKLEGQYGGGLGVMSKMIPLDPWVATNPTHRQAAQRQFAVHAWLANYDAVGLPVGDNLAISALTGSVFNFDPGGALLFRAQGKEKYEDSRLPMVANEWETMRTKGTAGQFYGPMTVLQLKESAQNLLLVSEDAIENLVMEHGPGNMRDRAALAKALKFRRADILERAGVKDLPVVTPVWDADFTEGSATLTGNNTTSSYMVISDGTQTQPDQAQAQASQPAGVEGKPATAQGFGGSIAGTETDGQLELYPTTDLGFAGIPETLMVDGVARPTANSLGDPIAQSGQAIFNFWKWFGDSKAIDGQGRPIVFYRGSRASYGESSKPARNKMSGRRMFFTDNPEVAATYGTDATLKAYLRLENIDSYDAENRNWTEVVKEELDPDALLQAQQDYADSILGSYDPSGEIINLGAPTVVPLGESPAPLEELQAAVVAMLRNEELTAWDRYDRIAMAARDLGWTIPPRVMEEIVLGDAPPPEAAARILEERSKETTPRWQVSHPMSQDEVFDNEEEAQERLYEYQDEEINEAVQEALEASEWDLIRLGFLEEGSRTMSTDALASEAEERGDDMPDAIWIENVDDTSSGSDGIYSTVVIVLPSGRGSFNIKNAETNTGKFDPENPLFDQRTQELGPQSLENQDWPQLRKEVETAVFDELGKMGLPESIASIIGRLNSAPKAKGAFVRDTNSILIMARLAGSLADARNTTRHEAIHYMKKNGFFTKEEWAALESWAKEQKTLLRQVRKNYSDLDLAEEKILEEVIAEGFARWAGGHKINAPRTVIEALQKIADLVVAALRAMARRGINHEFAEQIMGNVATGRQARLREARARENKKLITLPKAERAILAKERERLHDIGALEAAETALGKGFWAWTGQELEMAQSLDGEPDMDFSLLDDPTSPNPSHFRKLTNWARMAIVRTNNRMVQDHPDHRAAYDPTDTFRRSLKRKYFQERETVEEVAKRMEDALGTLPPDMNFWNQMVADDRGYHIDWFIDNQLRPLIDGMKKHNISVDDLEIFLYAKHAPFRNARMQQVNPEMAKSGIPGSGMSDQEAADIIQDVTDLGKLAEFEELANIVYAMNAKAKQMRIDSGLLTQAEADSWFADDEFYVPLRGNEEMEQNVDQPWMHTAGNRVQGVSVRGNDLKRAKGRKSRATEILPYVMAQHMAAIDRAYRHRVATQMLEAFQADPSITDDFVEINPIKRVPVWNEAKGVVEYQMQTRLDPLEEQRTIHARVNGQDMKMVFNAKSHTAMRFVAQAKALPIDKVSKFTVLFRNMTRLFSKSVTSLNPFFWLANAQADTGFAMLSVRALRKKYPGVGRRYLANLPKVIPALVRAEINPTGAGLSGTGMDFINAEREMFGGKIIFNQIDDLASAQRRLVVEMRQANRGKLNPLKYGRMLLNVIEGITSVTDNIHRLAIYAAMRDLGIDQVAAAKEAREITVNFSQRGEVGKKLNNYFAFANVGMIGAHMGLKVLRTAKDVGPAMFTLGLLYGVVGPMLFGDDWEDFSEEEKQRYFLLPNGAGGAYSWRTPHFFAGMITAGRKMAEYSQGRLNPETGQPITAWEMAGDVVNGFFSAMSPVQGNTGWNIIAPTAADPWVDLTLNQNFWGRKIRPERVQFDPAPQPRWDEAHDSTGPVWVAIARGLSDVTGGTTETGGRIDFSAESLKYLTQYYTGGPGRTAIVLMDVATGNASWQRLPVISSMVKNPRGENPEGQELGEFNDRYSSIHRVVARAENEAAAAPPDQPVQFIEENRKLIAFALTPVPGSERNYYEEVRYLRNKYSRAENIIDGLDDRYSGQLESNAEVNAINQATGIVLPLNRRITPEQRRQVLDALKERRLTVAQNFNYNYDQAVLGIDGSD